MSRVRASSPSLSKALENRPLAREPARVLQPPSARVPTWTVHPRPVAPCVRRGALPRHWPRRDRPWERRRLSRCRQAVSPRRPTRGAAAAGHRRGAVRRHSGDVHDGRPRCPRWPISESPRTAALAQNGRPSAGKVTLTIARRHVTALRLETRSPRARRSGRRGEESLGTAETIASRANSLARIVSASATHGQALRMRPAAIAGVSAQAWLTSAALQPRSTRRRSLDPPAHLSRPAAAARYWSAIAGSAEWPGSLLRARANHICWHSEGL